MIMGAETDQPALTIFYKGTVNTFQQVPHDKAKAIMLLLAPASSRSTGADAAATAPVTCNVDEDRSRAIINVRAARPRLTTVSSTTAQAVFGIAGAYEEQHKAGQAQLLAVPSDRAVTTSCSGSKPQIGRAQPVFCTRPAPVKRSQAELPFARKASLARFLEKRKDRVEAMLKAPVEIAATEGESGNEEKTASRPDSCLVKRLKLQHTDSH
ncbi:hypothetical protein GOP47_0002174 [Adiantum capillus-veneris]|uniref:Tify domain-containing protein n=1 Tax=Adiantum capillus-veneris TaxID=13818 RepID=A0A9D4V9M3_ADICA|nr:hypothetical protein GOP47_0001406 [Adiantum capillus-veneris]KAI5082431.1 hypothetical protein GOP47_0002174 [Adiantum capillus-veneris]